MKSSSSLVGGHLRPQYYAAFADYLLRFADGYAAAGIPLYALTVQNEPAYEAPDYASMRLDAADRARFIIEALGPRLAKRPDGPQLLEWDHNWTQPGSPLSVLAGGIAPPFDSALFRHAARPLEKQFLTFSPAEPADRTAILCHCFLLVMST